MIILSFNFTRLGKSHKFIFLKCLVATHKPNIFIIYKTIFSSEKYRKSLEGFLKENYFNQLDVYGNSKGLIYGWNPYLYMISSSFLPLTILLKLKINQFNFYILVLNLYGPYVHRTLYWDNLDIVGSFKSCLTILSR